MAPTAEWKRKEWTIKGADPTVVVAWIDSTGASITEFQNVYVTNTNLPEAEAERIHKGLEKEWQAKQEAQEAQDGLMDGGAKIYGGE